MGSGNLLGCALSRSRFMKRLPSLALTRGAVPSVVGQTVVVMTNRDGPRSHDRATLFHAHLLERLQAAENVLADHALGVVGRHVSIVDNDGGPIPKLIGLWRGLGCTGRAG